MQKPKIIYYLALFLGAGIFVFGCSNKKEQPNDHLNVTVTEPVDKGWDEIEETGHLQMITRYSSSTYFLHQGLQWGFEYELLEKFAEEQGLTLDVIVVEPGQNPYDMLNSGKGDVIAANYAITPARDRYVNFTHPYNSVNQVLVFSEEMENPPQTLTELVQRGIPVSVYSNSSYYYQLKKLQEQGFPINIELVPTYSDTESLLFDVANGQYMATVADDNIFHASDKYMDGLVEGPTIAQGNKIAWAVRENADKLQDEMNAFLADHFRIEEGEPKNSTFLNILKGRYFEDSPPVAEYYEPDVEEKNIGIISPFDDLFKEVADSAGVDWLLLAAIAAQETKFNPNATSWAGAIGLMQILPRYSNIDSTQTLYNVEINVREGVRILKKHLEHYSYIDSTDRWQFALAAYNAGSGHVADARRLAIDFNKNPNEWEATANALVKLMDRTYYKNARHGFCRGIRTVTYVRSIMNRYKTYQSIQAIAQRNAEIKEAGILDFF